MQYTTEKPLPEWMAGGSLPLQLPVHHGTKGGTGPDQKTGPLRHAQKTRAALERMQGILRLPPLQGVNLSLVLACCISLLVLLALARTMPWIALCATIMLVLLALLPARLMKSALGCALGLGLLGLLILAPSLLWGTGTHAGMVLAKSVTGGLITGLTAGILGGHGLPAALSGLHVPRLVVLVLELFLRYVVILGDMTMDLFVSLRLRSIGTPHKGGGQRESRARPLGGIGGTLFLASRHMAEEVHAAMVCRGFDGRLKKTNGGSTVGTKGVMDPKGDRAANRTGLFDAVRKLAPPGLTLFLMICFFALGAWN